MAFRGLIKDILILYLAYRLISLWLHKEQISTGVIGLTATLVLLVIWFMLERVGLLPKL